ncbi:hypothetical protein AVEN_31218-1 [Araneus ventricosus]|uniref:Uncharacterized protein n=1 Tax=Araneus ventricosus TaxID=182803 RepID=A0A4Y2VC87_ARAVE|nr:hypothetical protein AVEN_31218-1 [Araneus ventricosus]
MEKYNPRHFRFRKLGYSDQWRRCAFMESEEITHKFVQKLSAGQKLTFISEKKKDAEEFYVWEYFLLVAFVYRRTDENEIFDELTGGDLLSCPKRSSLTSRKRNTRRKFMLTV